MINKKVVLLSGVAACLLGACSPNSEKLSVTYFEQFNATYKTPQDSIAMYDNCIEYDSVRFSDGSWAVHQKRNAPQNALTEFFAKDGKLIATSSYASEVSEQVVIRHYDENGRLLHLLRSKGEVFDGQEPENDSICYSRSKEGYLGFRRMLDEKDYEVPDTAKYWQYNIQYDNAGDAVSVQDMNSGKKKVAPKGHKLLVEVVPCEVFWIHDFDGGNYEFKFSVVPK